MSKYRIRTKSNPTSRNGNLIYEVQQLKGVSGCSYWFAVATAYNGKIAQQILDKLSSKDLFNFFLAIGDKS